MTRSWTTVDELVGVLRTRWARGGYARARAAGEPFEPVGLPVRSPSAAELLEHVDEVRRWAQTFERARIGPRGVECFRVEHKRVPGRHVGENRLPSRIWIDSLEQLCALTGTTDQLRRLDDLLARTATVLPAAVPWAQAHPLEMVAHREVWDRLLAVASWIDAHATRGLYLRQLDLEGVDTKFVEQHRKILDGLLGAVLSPDRIDAGAARGDFARRFGFLAKPEYVRLRFLAPQPAFPPAITEVRLRADELPGSGIEASVVIVVENEISYLALPPVPGAVAVFGSGYGLEAAKAGDWLSGRQIVYWGDIDTHGFAILDGLRAGFPGTVSILMDTETLLAHRAQWVREDAPTSRALVHLTDDEASLYRDLVEDRYAPAVRLEQERVRFSLVRRAVASELSAVGAARRPQLRDAVT